MATIILQRYDFFRVWQNNYFCKRFAARKIIATAVTVTAVADCNMQICNNFRKQQNLFFRQIPNSRPLQQSFRFRKRTSFPFQSLHL